MQTLKIFSALSLAGGLFLNACSEAQVASDSGTSATEPIINTHMHAARLEMDDANYRNQVLAEMDAHNISKALLHLNEASDVEDWVHAAPGRFLAGPAFPCWQNEEGQQQICSWNGGNWPDIAWLRENYENGTLSIMGEMLFIYAGITPTDSRMDDYWALAAEFDIPVAIHINRGPPPNTPSRPTGCCPNFDADLGNPELLRPVLKKHPKLRIILQHAGFPAFPDLGDIDYLEETFALMRDYPNVYADMTALNSVPPPPVHTAAVRLFQERGYIDRLMMGTDNWDAAPIIDRYEGFDFLSPEQKRGILYENAVRFLRLEE